MMSLDIILFSIFLGLNLVVGLLVGRRVKNLREYAVGSKDFSTGTVTSTIVATWIGGRFMFYTLQNIYSNGLQYIIVAMGGTICLLLTGQVLAGRMGEFLNNLSIAEAMKELYGKVVQIITASSGILAAIGGIAIQFKVIAKMFSLLWGFEGAWVTVVAAGIVIAYSACGGIRAVTITDIFQFMAFGVFIPTLALIIWHHLQDPSRVVQILDSSPLFSWKGVIGCNTKTLSMLGLLLYFILPSMSPSIFQRIAMAKDVKQVRDSFTYAAWIRTLIVLSVAWIAILLLADPAEVDPANLITHIITQYAYPGLKGLIAIGITAMAMSTADSDMNATAVLIGNDICKNLKVGTKNPLLTVKLASVAIGIGALLLGLCMQNLLDLFLFSGSFYAPIISVPFLLAILGFRSKPKPVLMGMVAGLITVILWSIFFNNGDSIIPGMLANLVVFMGSHYILRTEGGWVGVRVMAPLLEVRQRRQKVWQSFKHILTPSQVYQYLQSSLPTHNLMYSLFGIYVIGATYTSFFTISTSVVMMHKGLYDFLAHSTLIVTAAFITYPAWPVTFQAKWFITFAWPMGVGYLLFAVGAVLVMLSGFHQVQVMIFMLNLIIAALLFPWPVAGILCMLGIVIGQGLFYNQGGQLVLDGSVASLQFKIFYTVLLFSASCIAIIRFRESKRTLQKEQTLRSNQEEMVKEFLKALAPEERFFKALDVEGIQELEKTVVVGKELEQRLQDFQHTLPSTELSNTLSSFSARIRSTSQYLDILAHRAAAYLRLEVNTISIDILLKEVAAIRQVQALASMPQIIINNQSKTQEIECDVHKLKKMLVNAILYAHDYAIFHEKVILLGIEDTVLGYSMNSIQGHIKKVPAVRIVITTANQLPACEPMYLGSMGSTTLQISLDKNSLRLLSNQRTLEAHYGYIAVEINPDITTQVYVIPQRIRDIRSTEMDIPELAPDSKI